MILLRYARSPLCDRSRRGGADRTSKARRTAALVALAVLSAFSLGGTVSAKDGWGGCRSADPDRRIAGRSEVIARIAKESHRNKIAAYANRGGAYHIRGDYDRAIEDFSKALRFDPKSARLLTDRAAAYRANGDFDRALADYGAAITVQPKNPLVFYGRGGVYQAKGDLDHAIDDFTEAIRLDLKSAQAYSDRARAWRAKGELDRAKEDIEKALRVDPQFASARKELEEIEKSLAETTAVSGAAPGEEPTEPSQAGHASHTASGLTLLSLALATARLAQFFAAMILLGASLFPFYALTSTMAADTTQVGKMVRRILVIAAFTAALSALAWAAASIAQIAGDVESLIDAETLSQYFFETSFGKVWLFRIVVAAALLVIVLLTRRHLFARNGATGLVAFLAAALLVSQAWIGHPASLPASQRWLVTTAYALHVLAAAVWLGALLPLGLLVVNARRGKTALLVAEFALRRFSPLGMGAVAAILLGGVINLASRADSFDVLAASGWGRIAMLKAAILTGMIAAAAINRFVLMPRLSTSPAQSLAALARNIAFEQAAGLLILAAAAFMAIFHPPGMHH